MQSVLTCLVHARAWLRPGRSCAQYGRTGSQTHMGVRTHARYLASHIWLSTHRKLTIQNAKCPYMPCACPSMVETWQIVCNIRENRVTNTHGVRTHARYLASHIWLSTHRKLTIQ